MERPAPTPKAVRSNRIGRTKDEKSERCCDSVRRSDFCFSCKNANRFSIPEGMLVSCCDRRKWKRIINRLSKKSFARSAHQIKNCNKLQLLSFECRAAAISRIEGYGLIKTRDMRVGFYTNRWQVYSLKCRKRQIKDSGLRAACRARAGSGTFDRAVAR